LAGVLYCGRCGRKMQVEYRTIRLGRYSCSQRRFAPSDEVCGGLPARGLDELITRQVLQAISPACVELSLCAIEHTSQHRRQQATQLRLNLERAIYEAERAERQYQVVEPENRIVARTLEARWEAALQHQCEAQNAFDIFQREKPTELMPEERRSLEELSRDIPALWHAPETTWRERKEITRCMIDRVAIITSQGAQHVDVVIQWAGGFESRHELDRPAWSYEQLDDFRELSARVEELRSAGWRSPRIAAQLNAEGFQTPKQRGVFTANVVRFLYRRRTSEAGARTEAEPEPPRWSADRLAERLKIPVKKLKDWVRCGWVRAVERPFGGRWVLHADERELKRLEQRVSLSYKGRHYPADLDHEPLAPPK